MLVGYFPAAVFNWRIMNDTIKTKEGILALLSNLFTEGDFVYTTGQIRCFILDFLERGRYGALLTYEDIGEFIESRFYMFEYGKARCVRCFLKGVEDHNSDIFNRENPHDLCSYEASVMLAKAGYKGCCDNMFVGTGGYACMTSKDNAYAVDTPCIVDVPKILDAVEWLRAEKRMPVSLNVHGSVYGFSVHTPSGISFTSDTIYRSACYALNAGIVSALGQIDFNNTHNQ